MTGAPAAIAGAPAEPAAAGDLANLYRVDTGAGRALLKLPRRPANNDLMEREAAALTRLERDGDPRHRVYAPRLLDSFRYDEEAGGEPPRNSSTGQASWLPPTRWASGGGQRRVVNVLSTESGLVSLADVARAHPGGVDPRDVAWMWRRLLVAIGYAHRAGVVHGAVLPDHVLIQPEQHGVVLVDWCYAVTVPGGTVPALVARYRDRYPPEVPARRPAGPETDIHLATGCMRELMGELAHPALLRFAAGCTLADPRRRPKDAWRLLGELDELLEDLYGPRQFRPFTLHR